MRYRILAIATAAAALAVAPSLAQSDEPTPTSTTAAVETSNDVQPVDSMPATTESTAVEAENLDARTVELGASEDEVQPATTGAEIDADTADADPYADADIPQEMANEPSELPRTASPLALLALVGASGIGSAAGLRYLRRR